MSYYIWTNTLDVLALTDAVVPMSVFHHTACVHIYKVSILVITVNVTVLNIVPLRGLLRAVINILFDNITLELR